MSCERGNGGERGVTGRVREREGEVRSENCGGTVEKKHAEYRRFGAQ